MTDKNKTKIVVLVDRSGSMSATKSDMEGGFAKFIEDQRKLPGECQVSLYRFDTQYDTVFENVDIHAKQASHMVIDPRGSTALLDAIGRTIDRVGQQLKALPENERPGAVIVMIITDGAENASREHTYASVQAKIKEQNEKYNWQFVYLGSDLSTRTEAAKMGIQQDAVAQFENSSRGINQMYAASSVGTSDYRKGVMRGLQHTSLKVDLKQPPDDASK